MNHPKPPDESSSPSGTELPSPTEPAPETPQREESKDAEGATPEPAAKPAEPVGPSVKAAPPKRTGRVLAGFAILIALAAAGASAYLAWFTQQTSQGADAFRADLAGDLGVLDRKTNELAEKLRALETERLSEKARFDELRERDRQLTEQLEEIRAQANRLETQGEAPRSVDWRLREVEYLLRIAVRQATLGENPRAALAALAEADGLLVAINDPAYQAVRRQLADDMLALKSAPQPDVEGLALRLVSLSTRVETLPLAGQRPDQQGTSEPVDGLSGWARLRARISDFFASIFTVRRETGSSAPMLSPEESFFLRRSLELELQAARIAVLNHDASAFRASLGSARRWAEEYFRGEDPAVAAFVSALGELESRDIELQIPDVSGSLDALLAMEQPGQLP